MRDRPRTGHRARRHRRDPAEQPVPPRPEEQCEVPRCRNGRVDRLRARRRRCRAADRASGAPRSAPAWTGSVPLSSLRRRVRRVVRAPAVQHVHGASNLLVAGLQQAAARDRRSDAQLRGATVEWMSWYLGPVTVAAAIDRRGIARPDVDPRRDVVRARRACAARAVERGVPLEAQHLHRPDLGHAPVPLLRAAADDAARVRPRRRVVALRTGGHPAVVPSPSPSSSARSRSGTRSRRSSRSATSPSNAGRARGARRVPHHRQDAAVVVLQGPTGLLFQWAPQTLRGWCNVPVAVLPVTTPNRAGVAHPARPRVEARRGARSG